MTLRTDLGRSETKQGLHMEWSARLGGGGANVKKRDNASLAMDTLPGGQSFGPIQAFGCTKQKMQHRTAGHSGTIVGLLGDLYLGDRTSPASHF